MQDVKVLSAEELLERVLRGRKAYHARYYAMYSSVWNGIVTDPTLMMLPIDDHVAHRGDGVFETAKCVKGGIYNLSAHLERLYRSAAPLNLVVPVDRQRLQELIVQTVQAGEHPDCSIRVLLSRGPGSLGANPYDCPEPQIYIIVSRLPAAFMTAHPEGARVIKSRVPPKQSFFARLKSCNYLPNVLMTREAADAGADFAVAFDEQGFLTEGATENFGIVTSDGMLMVPRAVNILAGTTMLRVMELAEQLVTDGVLQGVVEGDISEQTIRNAPEVLVFGTTRDVTAVVEFEGCPIGSGTPGPVYAALAPLLKKDVRNNEALRLEVSGLH